MSLSLNKMQEGPKKLYSQARASARIKIQVPVFLRGSDATGLEFIELTKTLNISARGACIACTRLLRVNQTVQLTIPAPSASSSSLLPSETPPILAKVCRQELLGDLRIVGLEFFRQLE